MKEKVVLILSGGLDSTTLLYDIVSQGYNVKALTFNYGQKHRREIECAIKSCQKLGVPQKIIDISFFKEITSNSALIGEIPVPDGRYDDDVMKQTVVPNRNMVLLSIAAAYAINQKAPSVYYGAHSVDHTIYPDCRPDFVAIMCKAFELCDWFPLKLCAPYLHITKGDIVKRGMALGVDYSLTWTCYKGGETPCGTCGSCTERAEAFEYVGVTDPLIGR